MFPILLAAILASPFQPELIVVTEKTKQYHRPWCPLVREAKDVVAMNVGQAESRGYKPHAGCDPAKGATNPAQAPGGTSQERQPPVYVYTAPGDNRYHRETCAKLGKDRKKVLLEEAGKKHWPCSVCRPPIRKRTPAVPTRYGRG